MPAKRIDPAGGNGRAEENAPELRTSLDTANSGRRKPLEKFFEGMSWPRVLVAIKPDGRTVAETLGNLAEVEAFVAEHDGVRNIYLTYNPTKKPVRKKPKKDDIACVEFLHVDIDPEGDETPEEAKARAMRALAAFGLEAWRVVDSGNGIQATWKLEEPVGIEEGERRNRGLIARLGGDRVTFNADRLLRLPGTRNLPNKKKKAMGRTERDAVLVSSSGAVHSVESFPIPDDVDELPVPKRIKDLIRGTDDPEHPYASRSEAVFAVLTAMARAECTDEQMRAAMDHEVGDHVRDQADPEAYLERQIERARALAVDPDVAEVNRTYAFVLVGDKGAIMETQGDEPPKFLSVSAFDQWHANKPVVRDGKQIPLSKYWMHHRQRREYRGVVFKPLGDAPGYYNLWHGFAVEPREGDCSKFLAHLRDNVCNGDAKIYEWVVAWLAQMFQEPTRKPGTSLALRGKQGVGKTKVGEVVGSLLGTHYVPVSDPRYITGRFNSHLNSCILLHADEAFWAGDHAAEGKLKDLITGQSHLIELKGKEPIKIANYVHLFVCGNAEWVVPAGFGERRFATLDVGDAHKDDHEYFAAIDEEMDNGGREALLYHFLNLDISGVDLRTIPKTEALLDQQLSSLTPEDAWLLDLLMRGELGDMTPGKCASSHLFDLYAKHANIRGVRRRSSETKIGIFLGKRVPGVRRVREQVETVGAVTSPTSVYQFPPLAECRAAFAQAMGQAIAWGEPEEWDVEPYEAR